MENGERKRAQRIANSLKDHRRDWEPLLHDCERFMSPRRGLFAGEDPANQETTKRGRSVNRNILNSTPIYALRTLKSGMQAGMTSPSRPWFRSVPSDIELRDRPAVKEYTAKLEHEARLILQGSGIYNALHTGYGDLGCYGTEAAIVEDDQRHLVRMLQLVPGSYWLGASGGSRIDTLYREFKLTVNQIVGKFANVNPSGKLDWNRIPKIVRDQYDKGDIGNRHTIKHLIVPRHERDPNRMDARNKPWASNYWMEENKDNDLLGEFGYRRNPISASRWETIGDEVYGRSPGMEALPDIKELMSLSRDKSEMVRRMNRPPMNAHTDMRNSAFSLMPGAVNFMADPGAGLKPAYDMSGMSSALQALMNDIYEKENDVWSGLYADLFLMMTQLDRRQITAREVEERSEEKMIALGPVIERMQFEKLNPLLDTIYERIIEEGRIGPPPPELEGVELEFEYISMLAQAQKAVSTGSIERVWSFAGNLAAVKPEVLDKLDPDETMDEYGEMLGVPPSIIRPTEEVQQDRAQRAQRVMAQEASERAPNMASAAKQGAEAAKVLAEADNPRSPQPGDILRRIGAQP